MTDAEGSPVLQATVRWVILEIILFLCSVIGWAVLPGAADVTTMIVLSLTRTLATALVWIQVVQPFRRWPLDEPRDHELQALDEKMAGVTGRFGQLLVGGSIVMLLVASAAGLVGIGPQVDIGAAELVCGALLLPAVAACVTNFQFWLWLPFEPIRIAVRARLRARGLVRRRATTPFLRSQLILSALTGIAVFFALAGLAGRAHIGGRRDNAATEQLRRAQTGALEIQLHGSLDDDALELVEGPPLEVSPQLEVGLERTEAMAAAPIGDGRWVLARAVVDEQLGWIVVLTLVFGAFLSVPLLGVTLASTRSQLEQFAQLGKAVRALIETGKTRGITRIVPRSEAEIDMLIDDFNALLDMLDGLTDAATRVAKGDLRSSDLDRPGDLNDAFRGMVVQLHAMVVQIRSTALDLASAAAEIHSITQEQEAAVSQQSKRMREVSETVASLASSAESITQTSAGVLTNADLTLRTTAGMIARIGELSQQASSIGELLERIREIADRSDLLALNGSLEATRAGDAGRGFALVAAEMRRLAERIGQTVSEVRWRVSEIDASGTNTELAAEDSRKLAEQTADAARKISAVTDRQGRETDVVARTIQEITAVVISTASATSQTRSAAEGLRIQAELLERLTRQFQLRPVDQPD